MKIKYFHNRKLRKKIKFLEERIIGIGCVKYWHNDGSPGTGYCGHYQEARVKKWWKEIKKLEKQFR